MEEVKEVARERGERLTQEKLVWEMGLEARRGHTVAGCAILKPHIPSM